MTTAAKVEALLVDSSLTDFDPYIEAAEAMTAAHCSALTVANKEIVDTWLAAHFASISEPKAETEKAGPVSQSIETKVDTGLDVTRFGQMAMQLDTTGGLAAWNTTVKSGKSAATISITWLGTEST